MSTEDINFYFLIKFGVIRNRIKLRTFIIDKIKKKGRIPGKIDFIFCSDDYLLQLNTRFLNHHYFTDILTFDHSEGRILNAEIYISVDRVRENAGIYQETIKNELHRVLFHGILHLLGLTDKTQKESAKMRRAEDRWLMEYMT